MWSSIITTWDAINIDVYRIQCKLVNFVVKSYNVKGKMAKR
ncbi:hypothetical protein CEAn_00353 [Coxiella endosymbiont of Amblyomma nuttalli]|nr:hypothetical protein CEAn_00353 [Coxiella endosymbiont of Amblyomma nuttalli]